MLLPMRRRVVLEVDGAQHSSSGDRRGWRRLIRPETALHNSADGKQDCAAQVTAETASLSAHTDRFALLRGP